MKFLQWSVAGSVVLVLGATAFWLTKHDASPKQALPAKLQCELPPSSSAAARPGMVWIPEGVFDMGDSVYAEEKPVRNVRVKGFWMDRTEVTNSEFAAFVKATGYVTVAERPVNPQLIASLPEDMRKPGAVVFKVPAKLSYGDDPRQWWQYLPGANWQHPTEAEWEWAARAGAKELPGQHDQPASANTWQGIFPMANASEDGFAGLAPVACYAPNAYGLFDMIGNVWELTADVFVAERPAASSSKQGLDPDEAQRPPIFKTLQANSEPKARVIKGGSFLCAPNYCMRYRAGSRQPQEEDLAVSHLGFRTIYQP
jgi:formylglycine-generating enzyme required for sulfatase activity